MGSFRPINQKSFFLSFVKYRFWVSGADKRLNGDTFGHIYLTNKEVLRLDYETIQEINQNWANTGYICTPSIHEFEYLPHNDIDDAWS